MTTQNTTNTPILTVLRGYPGSGKTTWAETQVQADSVGTIRVNRDDLRHSMFGAYHGLTYEQETLVSEATRAMAKAGLKRGMRVIVDETSLRAKYVKAWAGLAMELDAKFEVHDMGTPVDECVRRDAQRGRRVGEAVIRDMAMRFPYPFPVPSQPATDFPVRVYTPDPSLPAAWIVDVDGTLAHIVPGTDGTTRGVYDASRAMEDAVDRPVWDILMALTAAWPNNANRHPKIIVLSGRTDDCRDVTERWLRENDVPFAELHMRKTGDTRSDSVVKEEIFFKEIAPRFNVIASIDDRNQVVDMWRRIGLKCFQAEPGDF